MRGGLEAGCMWGGPTHLISFGEQREGAGFRVRVPPSAQLTPAQDSTGPSSQAAAESAWAHSLAPQPSDSVM